MKKTQTITYNILDHKSVNDHVKRKYDVAEAQMLFNSPKIREKLRQRELTGFMSHTIRQLSGDSADFLYIDKNQKNKKIEVMLNEPSNVTIALDLEDNGDLTHTQEILDTESGAMVTKLINEKIGGWSWWIHGIDGGQDFVSSITNFYGFDYVSAPAFKGNKKVGFGESIQFENKHQGLFEVTKNPDFVKITPEILNYSQKIFLKNFSDKLGFDIPPDKATDMGECAAYIDSYLQQKNGIFQQQSGIKNVIKTSNRVSEKTEEANFEPDISGKKILDGIQ